jgi:PAS domain S-box-containing protein
LLVIALAGLAVALFFASLSYNRHRRLVHSHAEVERKVAERTRELEQKTEQLANQAELLDLANDAILVRNAEGGITYWSKGAERLYGWRKEEALSRTTHELFHTEFPTDVSAILALDSWEGELRQKRRDGLRIMVASRCTTLRYYQGKAMGWLEINTDITARQRAEVAARSLSRRMLSLEADERRRIARELHDSLGQYLTSLKINLILSKAANENRKAALLAECFQITDQCLNETRIFRILFHHHYLMRSALSARWYVTVCVTQRAEGES